LEGSLD
jgi:hypothetical protein